ncbi:aminopeptidase N [Caulobacter ginsengisoli]|uniref:Aminopeptidase n=1 Tax=Caulobacter ginsengisoli TaxID=400775 RepID=A0ABU0IWJ3_9CAUL|nr:M1 family metallopeptidase [Caulobacter ginsengisoli]MDQ0465389.1 aminopeptidase N [Caulobacter ginsengisoli]
MLQSLARAATLTAVLLLAACAPQKDARQVLPPGVTPIHYDISVVPDAANLRFGGTMGADIVLGAPMETLTLNAANLKFFKVAVDGRVPDVKIAYDQDAQRASLTFAAPLPAGKHRLTIDYTGRIEQQAQGLFAIDYDGPAGEKKRLLATQFESPDARRFAPMWDEPALKATFTLSVAAPKDQLVVSNMPAAATADLGNGLIKTTFQQSPKMSSYLLFMAMGDLERVHRQVGKVDVGMVVKRGSTAEAAFGLDAAAKLLPYYDDYFGTPYPLPKLDMVAIPGGSTAFSAMENWGAILYFEKAVLVDAKVSSEEDRQNAFTTIAHEMAHQWFGDLVTMKWWDDIWLNEGFASWMETKATDHFHPEWSVWLQDQAGSDAAKNLDARSATHPVVVPVADARDTPFDTISYQKGQAVIRMIEAYVGEDKFRQALRSYMKKHAYGNATSQDLWAEVQAASGLPILAIARDFTTQGGVPMVKVSAYGEEDGVRLKQTRFGVDAESKAWRSWNIPVRVGREQGVMTPGHSLGFIYSYAVVNTGQTGYFRTDYDARSFARISRDFAKLDPADQLGVLNDSWALGEAGVEPLARWFALAGRLPADANPIVWINVADALEAVDDLYDGDPRQAAFRAKARAVLAPVWARVGWTPKAGEIPTVILLRTELIQALGQFDDAAVVAEARARFARMDSDPLPAAIRGETLRVVASHADSATWERLHALAAGSKNALEKQQFYSVLGAARDPALARRTLDLALSDEPPITLRPVLLREVSRRNAAMTWDFLMQNQARADAQFAPDGLASVVPRLTGGTNDPALAGRIGAWATAHGGIGARLKAGLSAVEQRARVKRDRLGEVDAWVRGA